MSAVSKAKSNFIARGWNRGDFRPGEPGVYRVVHAGYRKWDGKEWFKGSRTVKGAQASVVTLATSGGVVQPWKSLDERRKGNGPKPVEVMGTVDESAQVDSAWIEQGKRLEALGKVMQNPQTTIAQLAKFATAAGLGLGIGFTDKEEK